MRRETRPATQSPRIAGGCGAGANEGVGREGEEETEGEVMTTAQRSRRVVGDLYLAGATSPALARRFIALFRQVWKRIPLSDRRALFAHWRQTGFPAVQLSDGEGQDVGKTDWGLVAIDNKGCQRHIWFRDTVFSADHPESALLGLIAHELSHAVIGIEDAWLQLESEANRLCRRWGFTKELTALRRLSRTMTQ